MGEEISDNLQSLGIRKSVGKTPITLRMPKEDNGRIRYLDQFKPLPTEIKYLKGCTTEEARLRAVISTEFPAHLAEFDFALHTGLRRSEQYRLTFGGYQLRTKNSHSSQHQEWRDALRPAKLNCFGNHRLPAL